MIKNDNITHYCTRCEIEANHKELEKTFPEHTCWKKEITIDTIRKAAEESNKMQKEQTEKWTMMETNKEDWEADYKNLEESCINYFNVILPPEVKRFIAKKLSTQEEKIKEEERKRIVEEIEKLIKTNTAGNPFPTVEESVAKEIINKINNL